MANEPSGLAVVGGFVYRGSEIPSLQGKYIFGDYTRGFQGPDGSLFSATESANGTWSMTEFTIAGTSSGRLERFVLAFGQDDEGEVYVLTNETGGPHGTSGEVHKIIPSP